MVVSTHTAGQGGSPPCLSCPAFLNTLMIGGEMGLYEVKIYDGEGNLKEIVQPKLNYNSTNFGNKKPFNKIPAEKIDPAIHKNRNQDIEND